MGRRDLEELAKKIRYDLTAAQGKLSELTRAIAELPDGGQEELPFPCPIEHCRLPFKTQRRLEEHLANVHAIGLDEAAPPDDLFSAEPQSDSGIATYSASVVPGEEPRRAAEPQSDSKPASALDEILPAP